MSVTKRAKLLLTLDAFGTLFTPRQPIAQQYGHVATDLGFPPIPEDELQASFRTAFKQMSKDHPNYGRASGMKAPDWWAKIVKATFQPFTSPGHALPPTLIPSLLSRFSSSAGYRLYPDVSPLLQSIRASNTSPPTASASRPWPWPTTVVGVLSNSDDRVPSILSSLGLGVSSTSTTHFDPDLDMHFSVLSYDVGAEKPDRRIFEAARNLAAQMLSSSTTTASAAGEDFLRLHVGDDLAKDTLAAQQAGWHGVLLDREGRYESAFRDGEQLATVKGGSDEGSEAVWVIRDLAHLALWRPGTAR